MSAPPASSSPETRLSLFPSPDSSKPPSALRNGTPYSRRSESRERGASTPQDRRAQTPQGETAYSPPQTTRPPRTSSMQAPQHLMGAPTGQPVEARQQQQQQQQQYESPRRPRDSPQASSPQRAPAFTLIQQPRPAADVPGRSDTAFSDANTLVRTNSVRSRSSIAKHPLDDGPSSSGPPQALRSIFPTYNPEVSLNQQSYLPTQMSPTRVPRGVISRQQTYDDDDDIDVQSVGEHHPQPVRSPVRSPRIQEDTQWPARVHHEPPEIPKPSTTEQLRSLWKVTNGWKASASEGRVYCLKMSQEKDAPVYSLSSATSNPFYSMRLDPTSASANVTVTRHDPSKPFKAPKMGGSSETSSIRSGADVSSPTNKSSDNKGWQEILSTTLEEEMRKHPPHDGLVALLTPRAAAKMAQEKANDPAAVTMAEQECARLIWDADSTHYFLVHHALEHPFCITVDRSPAWSRTEYTLEHNESPQHIAKLTRDGTGGGWVEVDTGIAAQIDSFFIVDVAVTALLLVAAADDRSSPESVETFLPPPAPPPVAHVRSGGRLSKQSRRETKKGSGRIEEFEVDVESQDDSLGKRKPKKIEDDWPFLLKAMAKVVKVFFRMFVFILTIAFKCVSLVFKGLYRCVGSKY